jgi:hypothetical protein
MTRTLRYFLIAGTLSLLPREIRDKVYTNVLDFAAPQRRAETRSPSSLPQPEFKAPLLRTTLLRTALLQTSKYIHAEAEIVLYQVNEFGIWIDYDYNDNKDNRSIMARWEYRVDYGLQVDYLKYQEDCFMKKPPKKEILRHMQWMHLQIGTHCGIKEYDIVPTKRQTLSGPERPTYKSLAHTVEEICEELKACHQIHCLRVSLRSVEETPGSIGKVMEPLQRLRGIKKTNAVVAAMREDRYVEWHLRASYRQYMNDIMTLAEGTEAPKYVHDENDPDQSENSIFEKVGMVWGGYYFAPLSDEEIDGDQDGVDYDLWEGEAEDEEENGFGLFMNAMNRGVRLVPRIECGM